MTSRIIAKVNLDDSRVASDIEAVKSIDKAEETYDEFTSGFWKNVPLMNAAGKGADGLFRSAMNPAVPTDHIASTPYIHEIIQQTFTTRNLTMVRARDIVDASMMPHRDFLELHEESGNLRLLMVLEDNDATFNSDENMVFRMRKGEVWLLDAAGTHCAANFSTRSRVSLCLDFSFGRDFHPREAFASPSTYTEGIEPLLIKRSPLPDKFEFDIRRMGVTCNRHTFRDIAFMLGKLHFSLDAPIAACYDWLAEVAEYADDPAIVVKAEQAQRFYVEDRALHERFSFLDW